MADLSVLEQRLARAKAALRDEKKRKKDREDQLILSAVRRSGLGLVDVVTLLANRVAPEPVSELVSTPDSNDSWGEGDQS